MTAVHFIKLRGGGRPASAVFIRKGKRSWVKVSALPTKRVEDRDFLTLLNSELSLPRCEGTCLPLFTGHFWPHQACVAPRTTKLHGVQENEGEGGLLEAGSGLET